MSPKKAILRELARIRDTRPDHPYLPPPAIPGFNAEPERYQKTVNALLKDRIIEGRKGEDGQMALALNPHRLGDVRRALRPAWAHPGLWAAMTALGALGAGILM